MSDASIVIELIDERISDNNTQMFTSFPARVISYSNQFCTVKPCVRFRYRDGDTVEVGNITNVPVKFPSGGGVISSYPIKTGDTVWIDCSMVALDEWLTKYQEVITPSTRRSHALKDATATPCLYSKDRLLGVSDTNYETVFHKVDENGKSQEIISKMTMTPEGDIWYEGVQKKTSVKLNADKSIVIETEDAGTSLTFDSEGNTVLEDGNGNKVTTSSGRVEVESTGKIVLTNGSEEVVSLLQELAALLGNTGKTTTIVGGSPVPLTNAAEFTAIASRINSLKG